jgi:hypothetical protein
LEVLSIFLILLPHFLTRAETLDLTGCEIEGNIPMGLFEMTGLGKSTENACILARGKILTSLSSPTSSLILFYKETLLLGDNAFTGTLSTEIGKLVNLGKYFYIFL